MSNTTNRQRHIARHDRLIGRLGGRGGYTLLELLITMLVIALLSTLVGPTFVDVINRNRLQSELGGMYAMLSTARSEAVSRSVTVIACGSSDQSSCNSTSWENGWIIYADDGAGGGTADNGTRDGTELLLRVGQEASGSVTIRTRNFEFNGAADAGRIALTQDGFAQSRGSIVICDGVPAEAAALVVNLSGQARVAVDQDADGTLNLDDDSELTSCP